LQRLSDPDLPGVVAKHDAALVVMHLKGELNVRDPAGYTYTDVMREIIGFLYERTERRWRQACGAIRSSSIRDSSSVRSRAPISNSRPVRRTARTRLSDSLCQFAQELHRPHLRASGERVAVPSLATAAIGITAGARLLRVHDVEETVQLARMFAAIAPGRRATLDLADRMPERRTATPPRRRRSNAEHAFRPDRPRL